MMPFRAPQALPVRSTATTPSAVSRGVPKTRVEARQLASTKTMPTDRSSPAVSTGSVWAMATNASSTPLLAAVVATFAVNPA